MRFSCIRSDIADTDLTRRLNKKYGILTQTCNEEQLPSLTSIMHTKMEENQQQQQHQVVSAWKREWLDENLLRRFLATFKTVTATVDKLVDYFNWRSDESIDDTSPDDEALKSIFEDHSEVNVIFDDFYDRCIVPHRAPCSVGWV